MDGIQVVEYPRESRLQLDGILEESFEGWYLRHAKKTLREIETVRVAIARGNPIGLAMLKRVGRDAGYVFYIAVAAKHRKEGVGGLLLDDAIDYFRSAGMTEAYSSVEVENEPSLRLFESKEFSKTGFGQVSKRHGRIGALIMYKEMLSVPGETLLYRQIAHRNSESDSG